MHLKFSFFIFLSILAFRPMLFAGEPDYAVARIPGNLLNKANAVVRFEETSFEVISTTQTKWTRHYVVTILNEKGNRWAELSEVYNKHRDVSAIEGALYDASGRQLRKVRKKDIGDYSGVSANELMADDRIRYHNFEHRVYPYTVEYNIAVEYKSTLFFPGWLPQRGEGVAVEASSYTMICQPDYEVRFKAFNYEAAPAISTAKNQKRMVWTMRNRPAIYTESYAPGWQEMATLVLFGPTMFQVDQYKGNMASWQDFGKFIQSLRAGRDALPATIKETVHQLTAKLSNPRDKIIALYQYLQRQTRYISIQLGIGGWQPFPAADVAAKGYGDCKALTNYMASLLQEAGIRSLYTLVRAGEESEMVVEDFPSQQFNHVILCVPVAKDTIWLECTSQTAPAGYLGKFTGNRPVLLVDENGGRLVRTPAYHTGDNLQQRRIDVTMKEDGAMQLSVVSRYSALRQEGFQFRIQNLSATAMKEYLEHQLDFSDYNIDKFSYKEFPSAMPTVEERLDITAAHYATITGKRIFLVPNTMSRYRSQMPVDLVRSTDLDMGFAYTDIDSAVFHFAQPVAVESIPKDISMKTRFGNYSITFQLKENDLYYTRRLEFTGGRISAQDYESFASFTRDIFKADRSRIVLVTR